MGARLTLGCLAVTLAVTALGAQPVAAAERLPADEPPSAAAPPRAVPAFLSPYNSPQSLESFLVFSAPPRPNVPDGQIHWVDAEVPGIDVRGPDGVLRSMCPEDGLAWTLAEGDTYGGGGKFVAVECLGSAAGWQMLAFHLCEVSIQASISGSQRQYTRVPSGAPLAKECAHTHLSLGYYARPEARREVGCPQWYVQGRYWVNAACLAQARYLPALLPDYLEREADWELNWLRPEYLEPLRRWALPLVLLSLAVYVLRGLAQPGSPHPRSALGPGAVALVKAGIWLSLLLMLVLASAGPIWRVGRSLGWSAYSAAELPYQQMALAVGYQDWQLLRAFYQVAVARDAQGRPVPPGVAGKVFPPEAAAAIPFGETNAEVWGRVDPTQPGPYGTFRAWDAVVERWPVSLYERFVLGLSVSRTAQRQRDGLRAIAASADVQALGLRLGKVIRAEDLYGSSAGAVGRTQILPGHFAAGGLCGDLPVKDVWNDPLAVAECTTRYLTTSGCWGSWYATGDVWSALCGYNPGAWDAERYQWYWSVLQDRMTRLAAASIEFGVQLPAEVEPAAGASARSPVETDALASLPEAGSKTIPPLADASAERLVPTPVLGLLTTQALLQNGYGAAALPGPLADVVNVLAPQVQPPERRAVVRTAYRLFRAWLLLYYSPDELLTLGVSL